MKIVIKRVGVSFLLVFSLTLAVTHAQDINQGTYFVKPSGDDANTGRKTSPFETINKAASLAIAGDTVIIHGGLYRERVDPLNGGTGEDARIVYMAAKGEVPVIKGSEEINDWTDQGNGIWMVKLHDKFVGYYHCFGSIIENNLIEKIHLDRTFSGAEPAEIKFHIGVDITIRNNTIRDMEAQGIWIDFANQGWRISGNVFENVQWNYLHFEQNHGPFLVDNNIFIGTNSGKRKMIFHSTDAVVMAHNLFFNIDSIHFKSDDRKPSKFTPHTGNRIGSSLVNASHDHKNYNTPYINNSKSIF